MGYFCSNPWTTVFIWGNGDVTHCCYTNIGPIGNINRNTLGEIWRGKKIQKIRENVAAGKYITAGCEHFCRAYRWNKYYGQESEVPEISEGLGRLEEYKIGQVPDTPAIIGVELGGSCNFKCKHCLAPKYGLGLSDKHLDQIWSYVREAQIIRFVGGEFSINSRILNQLSRVGELSKQPIVFLNTNGHIGLEQYRSSIENLRSFHLKFSLEGVGPDYSQIRIGGNWERFELNLDYANELFKTKNKAGFDWRLYLNYCVMRFNFLKIHEVVDFATKKNIRLVVNPLNGMRHIDENVFMYEHLNFTEGDIEKVKNQSHEIIDRNYYLFATELKQHLDYIIRTIHDKKLQIPYSILRLISSKIKGQNADRLLYFLYKWKVDKKSSLLFLIRKVRRRLLALYDRMIPGILRHLFRKPSSSIDVR